jgi:DNA mismatch repair ATPase MutS
LDFYKEVATLVVKDPMYVQGANLLADIEFFETSTKSTKAKAVFDSINHCSLQGSKPLSMEIYKNPLQDVIMLRARIEALKDIEKAYMYNTDTVNALLTSMQANEKYIVWFFEEKEENLKELYDVVFFRFKALRRLNSSPMCLTVYNMYRMFFSPIFGIISPLLYFIIPYIILLYKLKLKIHFSTYMKLIFRSVLSSDATLFGTGKIFKYIRIISYLFSAVFYLQGVFSSVDLAKTVHKISKLLIGNLNGIIEYVVSYKELVNVLGGSKDNELNIFTKPFFNSPLALTKCFDKVGGLSELASSKMEFSIFKNFGQQLKTFKTIDRDMLRAILQHSYMVDTIVGAVKYKNNNSFSYPEILDIVPESDGRPVLHIDGMVHPCIDKSRAVENTVNLGQYSQEQNLIITSPNSSGKSILIKSIIVNVVMAQTMGITSANSACLTPFKYINTQINVPDATGHESLFEAEMHRCKHNLDMLLSVKGATLIVMDEIFNSTNPLEAVAGAFAVCKRMSQHHKNILIFTTHYNYLTKLAKEPECRFANYRMETLVSGEKIDFTYKFQRGVNKHLLALELLKKSGFESSVIEEAILIKNSLQSKVASIATLSKR